MQEACFVPLGGSLTGFVRIIVDLASRSGGADKIQTLVGDTDTKQEEMPMRASAGVDSGYRPGRQARR